MTMRVLYEPSWFWRHRSDPDEPAFFHDLHCLSGYGDRVTDLWAALTIARLHDPTGKVDVHWSKTGNKYQGFVGRYATNLFSVHNCRFVRDVPRNAQRAKGRQFTDSDPARQCIIQLTPATRQIILRSGREWGNSCPDRLYRDLSFYELDTNVSKERLIETYQSVARSTHPSRQVAAAIPDDISERVGVHIRLTDKLVDEENTFEMSAATWSSIERQGQLQVERCIDSRVPLFVCSDDPTYKAALIKEVRLKGGNVVIANRSRRLTNRSGYAALVDFFALSQCSRIIQMTKYSTFSIAAAIRGNVPLVNLHPADAPVGTRLGNWESALRTD
jgi:hypothetical protein